MIDKLNDKTAGLLINAGICRWIVLNKEKGGAGGGGGEWMKGRKRKKVRGARLLGGHRGQETAQGLKECNSKDANKIHSEVAACTRSCFVLRTPWGFTRVT